MIVILVCAIARSPATSIARAAEEVNDADAALEARAARFLELRRRALEPRRRHPGVVVPHGREPLPIRRSRSTAPSCRRPRGSRAVAASVSSIAAAQRKPRPPPGPPSAAGRRRAGHDDRRRLLAPQLLEPPHRARERLFRRARRTWRRRLRARWPAPRSSAAARRPASGPAFDRRTARAASRRVAPAAVIGVSRCSVPTRRSVKVSS